MTVCSRNPRHVYPGHNKACPWCAAAAVAKPASRQVPLPAVKPPKPASTPVVARPIPTSRPKPTAKVAPTAIRNAPPKPGTGTNEGRLTFFVLGSWIVTTVTVLVPWLIGTNVLRDSAFRPTSSLVYSISNRHREAYFLTDYLAGLAVTTVIAGVLLALTALLRIRHRICRLLLGVALVALSLAVLTPFSAKAWVVAEQATAHTEATSTTTEDWHDEACATAFPTVSLESAGVVHVWSVAPKYNEGDGSCTVVEIWDGLRLVNTVKTPNLRGGHLAIVAGTSADDSYVQFIGRGPVQNCRSSKCQPEHEIAGGFSLVATEVEWKYSSRFGARSTEDDIVESAISLPGVGMVALENPETSAGSATAFDPATGAVLWRAHCPADFPIGATLFINDNDEPIFLCYSEEAFTGDYLELILGDEGSLQRLW